VSILEYHTAPKLPPSRQGAVALGGLFVIACGAAVSLWMPPGAGPVPKTIVAELPRVATPWPAALAAAPESEPVRPKSTPAPVTTPAQRAASEPPLSPPEPALRVSAAIPGASVFLDRTYIGTTPIDIFEVSPGSHRLIVSAEGYEGFGEFIDIGDDPVSIDVRFLEVRLAAAVEVVLEHEVGSCHGLLRADLTGLHFESDHETFSMPLSEIEQHEVDYLAHTLTLARRAGGSYTFTDEQESADALFVFHREVEKVRDRLSAESSHPPIAR